MDRLVNETNDLGGRMSNIQRRLEAMRRDLHDMKRLARLSTHDLPPEKVAEMIDIVLINDKQRIGTQL